MAGTWVTAARRPRRSGITYRQLDYWARTDLVRPSLADANGSGTRRRYSYRDLLELKVVKSLLDAGIRLELVREVFSYLRDQLGEDVTTANLVINGSTSVVVRSGDEMVDLIQQGQGVLNILPSVGCRRRSTPPSRSLPRHRGGGTARQPPPPPESVFPPCSCRAASRSSQATRRLSQDRARFSRASGRIGGVSSSTSGKVVTVSAIPTRIRYTE